MINLYYDLTTGSVLGYATSPALDAAPPIGQGVLGLPDGTPFTDQQGRVSVHVDLTTGKATLNGQ